MNTKSMIIPSIIIALSLAGCSSGKRIVDLNLHYVDAKTTPVNSTNQHAQAQIAETATSVSHSLQDLSAIELANNPGTPMPKPANAKALGMSQLTSVDWSGPVEPILRKIAKLSHYRLNIIGKKPAIAVLTNLSARNETLANILRDIRYQVANQARVAVYPKQRVIELRYQHNLS